MSNIDLSTSSMITEGQTAVIDFLALRQHTADLRGNLGSWSERHVGWIYTSAFYQATRRSTLRGVETIERLMRWRLSVEAL